MTTPNTASTIRVAPSSLVTTSSLRTSLRVSTAPPDDELNLGAGDQGLMFGYACDETPTLMPAPIYYAHRLVERQSIVRKNGSFPTLRPDAKSQVTLRYRDGQADRLRHDRALHAACP